MMTTNFSDHESSHVCQINIIYRWKSFYQMKGDVGIHNAKNHRNQKSSQQDDSTIISNP